MWAIAKANWLSTEHYDNLAAAHKYSYPTFPLMGLPHCGKLEPRTRRLMLIYATATATTAFVHTFCHSWISVVQCCGVHENRRAKHKDRTIFCQHPTFSIGLSVSATCALVACSRSKRLHAAPGAAVDRDAQVIAACKLLVTEPCAHMAAALNGVGASLTRHHVSKFRDALVQA